MPETNDRLRRLRSTANIVLTGDDLALDNPARALDIDLEADTEIIEDTQVTLDALDSVVADAIARFPAGEAAMDKEIAIGMHKALPLTRRVAADRRMWHYLGLVRYPEFVCHRFGKKTGKDGVARRAKERFLGDRIRNAFARLWWACELTRNEDDYTVTEALLGTSGFQDSYEAFFGREFSAYRPALTAAVRVLSNKPESVVRESTKELNRVLTTLVLESRSEDEIAGMLEVMQRNHSA